MGLLNSNTINCSIDNLEDVLSAYGRLATSTNDCVSTMTIHQAKSGVCCVLIATIDSLEDTATVHFYDELPTTLIKELVGSSLRKSAQSSANQREINF